MVGRFAQDGYVVLPYDPQVAAWAAAAHAAAVKVCRTPGDLRHGRTWRVGVDELPNAADGSVAGVPLGGAWDALVQVPDQWHKAQLSVVYPGYPQQDAGENDAAHRYRVKRDAAHVDGLLPEGPEKRRHLREPHSFVLGLSLNVARGSPLVVWPGSHRIMGEAFGRVYGGVSPQNWGEVDVTDAYQAARRAVFDACPRVEVPAQPGEAVLLHRHLLHGVAPWGDGVAPAEGRMIAYFRPEVSAIAEWL